MTRPDDNANVTFNGKTLFDGADALAYVEHAYNSKGDATKLTLSVNLDFYKDMDQTDPNGYTSASAGNLDRTIAHEFTHAVMAANINNFHSLPKYIKEGAAEYTHGIDDFRKYTIDNSFNEAMIDDAMTTNRSTSDQEKPYVVGYAFEAEAISSFKADFKAAGDAKTFLKRYCDIDTSDESDTGSATPTWRRK